MPEGQGFHSLNGDFTDFILQAMGLDQGGGTGSRLLQPYSDDVKLAAGNGAMGPWGHRARLQIHRFYRGSLVVMIPLIHL